MFQKQKKKHVIGIQMFLKAFLYNLSILSECDFLFFWNKKTNKTTYRMYCTLLIFSSIFILNSKHFWFNRENFFCNKIKKNKTTPTLFHFLFSNNKKKIKKKNQITECNFQSTIHSISITFKNRSQIILLFKEKHSSNLWCSTMRFSLNYN